MGGHSKVFVYYLSAYLLEPRDLISTNKYLFLYLFLIEFPEGNAPRHQDGGCLGDPEDFPAETLEECCEVGLASGFPPTGAACQHKLVHSLSGGHRVTNLQVFHLVSFLSGFASSVWSCLVCLGL